MGVSHRKVQNQRKPYKAFIYIHASQIKKTLGLIDGRLRVGKKKQVTLNGCNVFCNSLALANIITKHMLDIYLIKSVFLPNMLLLSLMS